MTQQQTPRARSHTKIGEGWQYRVHDLHNGRVRKSFHRPVRMYWVLVKAIFPFTEYPLLDIPHLSRSMKKKALTSLALLKKNAIPPEWIGNPTFVDALDFEQDKARPLREVFSASSTEEIRSLIDKFIEFNIRLLSHGIMERSFNITKNFGLNDQGEIVLIDIGELFEDPNEQRQMQIERVWAKPYVADCIADTDARTYFVQRMDEVFGIAENRA